MILKSNFHQIDSYLTDNVMKKISGSDWKVLSAINRFLIGWHKTQDFISFKKLEEFTGLSLNTISTSIKNLSSYKIIVVNMVYKAGIYHQEIKLNLNVSEYILPEIIKITKKVSNFFKKNKTEKTIETFKNEHIIINQPSQKMEPLIISNFEKTISKNETVGTQKMEPLTISKNGTYIKDINIKTNLNTSIHNTEEIKEPVIKKKDGMNGFKNFDKNKTSTSIFNMNNLSETKKYRADLLMSFGIETKNKSFLSFLEIDTQNIQDMIACAEWDFSQGRITSSKQGFLCHLMTKFLKEKKEVDDGITENYKTNDFNSNEKNNAPGPVVNVIKKPAYLEGEITFKSFCFEKGLIYSVEDQNTLEMAIKSTVGFGLTSKKFLLELKELGFTKQKMESFIEKVKDNNPILFTQPTNRLEKKSLEQFYTNLENPSILDEKIKEPFKPTMDHLFSKIKEVSKKIENVFTNNQCLDEDFIPC